MTVDIFELYDYQDKLEGYIIIISIKLFSRVFWFKRFEYHTTGFSAMTLKHKQLRDVS